MQKPFDYSRISSSNALTRVRISSRMGRHPETEHGRRRVLQQPQPDIGGQALRGDPGPDDNGHQQTAAEELGDGAAQQRGGVHGLLILIKRI